MTQSYTHSNCQTLSNFRAAVLNEILSIRQKIPDFLRSCQFLSISILDKFVGEHEKKSQPNKLKTQDYQVYFLSCTFLACKFSGKEERKFQKFMEDLLPKENPKEEKNKILEAQSQILEVIDFEIPFETPFTHLQEAIQNDKGEQKNKSEHIRKSLKILLKSVKINSKLCKNPSISGELYKLIKTKKGTRKAKEIYEEVRKAESN